MLRRLIFGLLLLTVVFAAGCGSNDLSIPQTGVNSGGTTAVSEQFARLGDGIPDGRSVTFVRGEVILYGDHYSPTMRAYLGRNIDLARRSDSLMTTDRHLLPGEPFVYTDPDTGEKTVLEVEVPFQNITGSLGYLSIPPAVACAPDLTNPIIRLYNEGDGSSFPVTDIYHVVGPLGVALTPRRGLDIGNYAVTVHGDFFSPYTQVAFRYVDPADGQTKILGNTPETDIPELYIDRFTLVVPDWPGVVPNSTLGLAEDLDVDLLLYENIDAIASNLGLEPNLGGVAPSAALQPNAGSAPLVFDGVRNSEKANAFTFLPTGVTDYPLIEGVTPESGSEIGGNTVIIHGQQFDAFTTDISDPNNPGIGIECPPDSGKYIAPIFAALVDRQTIAIKMPPCSVDIPSKVNFALKNKFSMDRADENEGEDRVIFEDVYEYIPVPPIAPPVIHAIYPAGEGKDQPYGTAYDHGLQRLMVVGDWFDTDTALNGGFEFLLPSGDIVQSLRTIYHNRNLIEVFTKRLPDSVYPLTETMGADIRVRNVIGHSDFEGSFIFMPTPAADGYPELDEMYPTSGRVKGGNEILLLGSNFDSHTQVFFDETEALDVQFLNSGALAVTVPAGSEGLTVMVAVIGEDEGEGYDYLEYTYSDEAQDHACPVVAFLDPDEGAATGGYEILAYGANLTPLTRFEFGATDGNFSPSVNYISSNLMILEVPEAYPSQIGATVQVGTTDPYLGCEETIRTTPFTYVAAPKPPEIHFVSTTVVDPITPTLLPAINIEGGDRVLVVGAWFDQNTTFHVTKGEGEGEETSNFSDVVVLTPNLAVMIAPSSPDGEPGVADMWAENEFGESEAFPVEYVEPGPPAIVDVRNLDDGTQTSPIDANDRLLIFGSNFFSDGENPITVRLTGCDLNDDEGGEISVELTGASVTLVENHLIGINIPADTFCEGSLGIEVITAYGTSSFVDSETEEPLFELIGPQPPMVDGVFEKTVRSLGGDEVIFFGRYFTDSTVFTVRSDLTEPENAFIDVLSTKIVSETVALVTMPALLGGMPPTGVAGSVMATETDEDLARKISGEPFFISEDVFFVINEWAPSLYTVHADHGSIAGGEQVLLIGENFLTSEGESNITGIRFYDPKIASNVGNYAAVEVTDLPLNSLDSKSVGLYYVLNDHEIVLITNPHAAISPEDDFAPVNVIVDSNNGSSILNGGFSYMNTPAVRTPFLLGLTPNETRLNGGTSHLLSGGFLTEADRIILTDPVAGGSLTLDTDDFAEVNDSFMVFVMPDLSGEFSAPTKLSVYAEKDVNGSVLTSNTLTMALDVSFAGPPTFSAVVNPTSGSAFGGQFVEISGTLFTPQSQVLFGTMPARHVVYMSPTKLVAVAPMLPVDLDGYGTDLQNLPAAGLTTDVAVFTQGGWAVLKDGYTFTPQAPMFTSCDVSDLAEGDSARVTIIGNYFIPGDTTVTPTSGTVTNLVVESFERLSFDYEADEWTAGTLGPKTDALTISTGQGTAASTCDLTIHLTPFVSSVATSYTEDSGSAPTTGVEDGAFVEIEIEGGNFQAGGSLSIELRTGTTLDLTEIGSTDSFSGLGQFRVEDGETIVATAPYAFPKDAPTLVDGNPNVGPVDLHLMTPLGLEGTYDKAFGLLPALVEFEDYSYTIPFVLPTDTIPQRITVGDINADGMDDLVAIARQDDFNSNDVEDPDAFVFMSDTFGAGVDVNGDGITPDFAGTFTKTVIENDNVKTHLFLHGRGGKIRLANLDEDEELELIIPVQTESGSDRARLLLQDVESGGSFGSQTILDPSSITSSFAIAGIATGNFDTAHDGIDIAAIIGGDESDRRIVIFASDGDDFDAFTDSSTDIDDPWDDYRVGFLESGDFDNNGEDDLIWGHTAKWMTAWEQRTFPIVVAEIDADGANAAAKVLNQKKLTNFTGGSVKKIEVYDVDGDGNDDAIVMAWDGATGDLLDNEFLSGVVAVVLDPLGLEADDYFPSGYTRQPGSLGDGGSNHLGRGDFNGDGIEDLVVLGGEREFSVFLGNRKPDGALPSDFKWFRELGRSWTLPTAKGDVVWAQLVDGVAAADLNHDGLAEIFMSDAGASPKSIIVWLNKSR